MRRAPPDDGRVVTGAQPPAARLLRLGTHALDLALPLVMGIVNVTPDSFSDGGAAFDTGRALAHARAAASPTARTSSTSAANRRARAPPRSARPTSSRA